jgi:hypothetical protein
MHKESANAPRSILAVSADTARLSRSPSSGLSAYPREAGRLSVAHTGRKTPQCRSPRPAVNQRVDETDNGPGALHSPTCTYCAHLFRVISWLGPAYNHLQWKSHIDEENVIRADERFGTDHLLEASVPQLGMPN